MVGEFLVGRDQVRTWHCDCSSIVFQGDRLLSDDFTAENAPRLLSYPDDGSKPVRIVISGLPRSRFPTDNAYSLVADVPPADVIVGYGMGVSASGGPQLLYRVDAEGRAVPFTPVAPQMLGNTAPERFMFSPDGTRVGFLLGELAGVCADDDTAVLANVATGAETQPTMPARHAIVPAVGSVRSGTVYASTTSSPSWLRSRGPGHRGQRRRLASGLPPGSRVPGSGQAAVWSTRNPFAAAGRRRSTARSTPPPWERPHPPVSGWSYHAALHRRLSRVPGHSCGRRLLRLCPLPPCPRPRTFPVSPAVPSPAVPPRRQAAQALAVLLAQSGTDRASVTQAVGAVADCSAWPEPGRDDLQQRCIVTSSPAGQARRPA